MELPSSPRAYGLCCSNAAIFAPVPIANRQSPVATLKEVLANCSPRMQPSWPGVVTGHKLQCMQGCTHWWEEGTEDKVHVEGKHSRARRSCSLRRIQGPDDARCGRAPRPRDNLEGEGCQRSAAREENVFELARHRTPARLQTQDDAGTRPRGLVQRKGPADAGACSLVCLACLLTNHQNHTSKHSRRRLPGIGAVAAKPALDFSKVRIRMISLSRRPSLAVMRTSGGKWQTQLWIHTLQTQVRIHSLPIHDCVKHQESGTHRRQQGAADGVRALDWRPARGARRAGAAERPLNGPCDEELPPVLSPWRSQAQQCCNKCNRSQTAKWGCSVLTSHV